MTHNRFYWLSVADDQKKGGNEVIARHKGQRFDIDKSDPTSLTVRLNDEFVDLNFDFHPQWMFQKLAEAGFGIRTKRTVSHLRMGLLKRTVPTKLLVTLDGLFQPTGRWWQLTPSVFVRAQAPPDMPSAPPGAFFRCPACRSVELREEPDLLTCTQCGRGWKHEGPFYDFKNAQT